MPTNMEYRRTLLDAARAEPNRRERRRLLLAASGYAAVFVVSVCEIFNQSMSRRIVGVPKWWFAWIVFGCPGLVCLFLSVSRFLVARSLGNLPGWTVDTLARLPPNIARLVGLTSSSDTQNSRGDGGGFALGGGVLVGGDRRGGTEMTTPEVLRSTSLRSRSSARNASTTPQQQQQQRLQQQAGGGGDAGAKTPARGTPSERRLFSPEDAATGWMGPLTPLEREKAGRRAATVRPEDVEGLMKEYDDRHAKPASAEGESQPNAMALMPQSQGFQSHSLLGGGAVAAVEGRGYYGQGAVANGGWGGGAGGGGVGGGSTWTYEAYEPGETEVASGRQGKEAARDKAERRLVRLGIAEKTDEFTKNVKTYVVRLMRRYLEQFDGVCSLLHERGVSEGILRRVIHRQPQLRIRNSPRAFVNLSLKDMATQFVNQPDFWVQGADGTPTSLFLKYQHLEEALNVTAGSGAAGVGNPAYVLGRLRVLAEDDFMSAFIYDKGGGYPANRDWSPDLPTDAAVVMRLFVCCSDELLPKGWEEDRPFARQHFVDRQPSGGDALPGRFFLTRKDALHPPHFFVVANQEVWHTLPGPTNVFQAMALFFYAIKTQKSGYLGTGVSVAGIVREIFGGE